MTRHYEQGRSIAGWEYGEQITERSQVSEGDVLIGDSHQFEATNLYRVVPLPEGFLDIDGGNKFYVVYIDPNGERADGEEMCVWSFDLTGGQRVYYRAVAKSTSRTPPRQQTTA